MSGFLTKDIIESWNDVNIAWWINFSDVKKEKVTGHVSQNMILVSSNVICTYLETSK